MKPDIRKTAAAVAASATVASAAVAAKKIKEKTFCPICTAKKLINSTKISQCTERGYDNGTALTPPMGWSSWNLFRHRISEDLIKEIADAMAASGLADCGYRYVNIDDCWQASTRDADGKLQCDKVNFPSGIKALAEYVNSKGIKLGIYSSNGTFTCEDYPASLRHERIDAETFAEWGVEYFKYDFCHNVPIPGIAPRICAVSVADKDTGEVYARYTSAEMKLRGMARIVPDEKVETKNYIDGLDAGNGSFTVEFDAKEEGDYLLHIDISKDSRKNKFIMAKVNGREEIHIYCVSRHNWTPEGKLMETIHLEKGVNVIEFKNPVGSKADSAAIQYKLMGRELKRATKKYAEENGTEEKPIVFSICEWGRNRPWKWGQEAGNLWRTTPDIGASWISFLGIYEHNVRLAKYAGPGAWNDPDMLEVGNGNLTIDENISHFSLWCMMNAPLILGNDVRKFIKEDGTVDTESKIYQILTNKTMIGINQDVLGVQCRRIRTGVVDILVKPLEGSRVALCVFNKGKNNAFTNYKISDLLNIGYLNLPKKDGYKVLDVWEDRVSENATVIRAATPCHGSKVYIIE
ncbi:MAG: glycoside hydrolase family 27 protein [Clostridia bacterium]|nr:glycoside hydrolase family 27 protein [Clostridia bacterium]